MNQHLSDPALHPRGFVYADQITVSHCIARALKRHGVEFIFGQSLPSMLHLACEQEGIQQIAYRQENTGGYMADGYARSSARPAILTAQNGPAATLLVPALAEALKASIPIIALVQEVSSQHTDRNAFQEFDHHALFASCAKWVRTVREASRVEDYIDQAMTIACSGRPGPVVLMLPADLLIEQSKVTKRTLSLGRYPLDRPVADPIEIEKAATLLSHAKNPVVIAGGGVMLSQAWAALSRLQETAHLPVATTVMGKGSVDESHSLSLGVMANFLAKGARARHNLPLLREADVILLVGTRTNQNGTDSWSLYPENATFIHIDTDGCEVGRNYEALRLVGDARNTLEALTAALEEKDLSHRSIIRPTLEQQIAAAFSKYQDEFSAVMYSDQMPLRPERVMTVLQNHIRTSDIVVADASYSSIWITNGLLCTKAGQRFLTPRGLAGLGWGFPMALGAKIAQPQAEVYAVVGDGGFAHAWAELETAARTGTKAIVILLNNGILGFQKHAEHIKFGAATNAVNFVEVDHAAIARAAGCEGVRVHSRQELESALEQAKVSPVTTVIEVICDEHAYPPITAFSPEK